MIETALKKFGLNDKEIQVYLAILKLGSAPVRTIAAQADINRTTTHDVLNKLINEGLASFVDKQKHRYFTAESPEHLINALEVKKKQLEQTKTDINNILPELKSIYEKSGSKPRAKYFEGQAGLHATLQDVLDSTSRFNGHKEYYVYSSSAIRETVYKVFPDYNARRNELGISVKTISLGEGGELHGLDERKWLTRDKAGPSYTLIYASKIALISLDEKKQPLGVILEDKNTYQTQTMIFNALWKKI